MIKRSLGISVTDGHHLYLGLPTFSLRGKRTQFGYLRDRVIQRMTGWGHKHFSEGGREILIKVVLQALPCYAMACFRIPTMICDEIERECANFWWGLKDEGSKIHWSTWNELCKPKHCGGLGFRKLVLFNKSLLAKQVWRIICDPSSLVARVFKARYFKHVDIMDAELGYNPSYIWRSLCWSRDVLLLGLRWRVCNGDAISIFKDAWVLGLAGGRPTSRIASGSTVSRFISEPGVWNADLVSQAFLPYEVDAILRTLISGGMGSDSRYWAWDVKGKYMVASGYKAYWMSAYASPDLVASSSVNQFAIWWSRVWSLNVPPKVRIFLWKVTLDFLATEGNLFRHHVPVCNMCFICGKSIANTRHVLFYCSWSKQVWKNMGLWYEIKDGGALSIPDLLLLLVDKANIEMEFIAMVCWAIWKERCNLRHSDRVSSASQLSCLCRADLL